MFFFSINLVFLCPSVECPNPEVNNTNVITMDNSPGGYVLSLTCKGRHRHISWDLERTCNRNGTWTGTPPVCKGNLMHLTQLFLHDGT